jgi:hypothetical protein
METKADMDSKWSLPWRHPRQANGPPSHHERTWDDFTWRAFLEQLDATPLVHRDSTTEDRAFAALARAIEERLECSVAVEDSQSCQDEAVYGRMLLPREVLTEDYMAWLSASRVGNLATVWDWDGVVQPKKLALIVETVGEHRLFYVPSAVLYTTYTGSSRDPHRNTWHERFFGYL